MNKIPKHYCFFFVLVLTMHMLQIICTYASTIDRYPSHPHPVHIFVFYRASTVFSFSKTFKDFCLLIGFTALTSWLCHVLTSLTSFCDHLDKMYSRDLFHNHEVHEDQPSLIWRKFSKYDE